MNDYLSWNYYAVPDNKTFLIKKKKQKLEININYSDFRLVINLLTIFLDKFISYMMNYIVYKKY